MMDVPPGARPAASACARLKLTDDARALLKDEQPLADFQGVLTAKGLYADAIRVTAACLPPRQAVWWGVLCLWSLARPTPPPELWAVIQATLEWLREPSDAHRRAAEAAGRSAGVTTPAGNLGLAVFMSEGSIAPVGQAKVAPEPHLTPVNVAAALLQASRKLKPEKTGPSQAQFLAIAHDVAQGKLTWA